MHAALVRSFATAPRYEQCASPVAAAGEELIHVKAAALSPLVKSIADGSHYSSMANFPFVPGSDGIGQRAGGGRVYFAFPRHPHGSMAELSVVAKDLMVPVPDGVDDVTAAAIANPGMSSWAALTERAKFVAGENVLINGATGISGRLAIQIARYLGAGRIYATGRNRASVAPLGELGADVLIPLDGPKDQLVAEFQKVLGGVQVVLDYLWGEPAAAILAALSGHGSAAATRLRFVQIGSLAGTTVAMPAAVLRSSGLELLGSGLGSVAKKDLVKCVGALLQAVVPARLKVDAVAVNLCDVGTAWQEDRGRRMVFTV